MGIRVVKLEAATPSVRADPTDATAPAEVPGTEAADEHVLVSDLDEETSRLEELIVRIIENGNGETLQPNSGNFVEVGQHKVAVTYNEGVDFRTWEWQGHIILFEEEDLSYMPEYVCGYYMEPLRKGDSLSEGQTEQRSEGLAA